MSGMEDFDLQVDVKKVPYFPSRPSFDQIPSAKNAFDFMVPSKGSKSGARKQSVVDVLDLEGAGKIQKKSTKKSGKRDDYRAKLSELSIEEEKPKHQRKYSKAFQELNQKTTIVEDLHIGESWGTVTPRARGFSGKISSSEFTEGGKVKVLSEIDEDGLSDDDGENKSGLLSKRDQEIKDSMQSEAILTQRRNSLPSSPVNLKQANGRNANENPLRGKRDKDGKPFPASVCRLYEEAGMGWTESQFTLGYCFDTGSGGVEPDTDEAIYWYQEAAQAGHVTAQNNLGVLLATGHRNRIRPNAAEALIWYTKAANHSHPNAQFHLGLANLKGEGVEKKNENEAFRWFKLAAKQGHLMAQANVGAMYMSGQGVEQNFEKAKKWSQKAANKGSAIAHHNLAVIFWHGYGVKEDRDEAKKHIREALGGANSGIISKKLSNDTLNAGNTLMNL